MPKQLRIPDSLLLRLLKYRQGFESPNQLVARLLGDYMDNDEHPSPCACPKCGCNELLCGYRGDIESCSSECDNDVNPDEEEDEEAS